MNSWQKFVQSIKNLVPSQNKANNALMGKKDKKGLYHRLKQRPTYKVRLDVARLEQAILAAENPHYMTRLPLYDIYKEVMRDAHLLSQTRTIQNKVVSSDFKIERDGQEQELQKELLRRPWFMQYMKYYVETIWFGHSLIEFCPKVDSPTKGMDKEFNKIQLIPRNHVHPWSGQVVIDPNLRKGFNYRDKVFKNILIEIGEEDDLGLLSIAAKEVIYKSYSRTDWSRHSEKFGMPTIIVRTASREEKELDNKEMMAANLGTNSYAILDDQDEITLLETSKTDAFKIYLENIKLSEQLISKLIAGQTGTADEQAWAGTASVHERVLNAYVLSIMIELQDHINFKLIPFLTRNGYPLQGCKLVFDDIARYYQAEDNNETMPETATQKKKVTFSKLLLDLYKQCSCTEQHEIALLAGDFGNMEQLIGQAVKRIYDKKLAAGNLDKGLWNENVQQLVRAIEEGMEQKYVSIEYGDKDYELSKQLKRNIYSFAAFKNHDNIAAMVGLLEEDGEVVDFSTFKQGAEKLGKVYNVDWLRSEYQTAIAQSQMAIKWGDIERDKESLPLLQYYIVDDERTRADHRLLDGVTLPVDDDFWKEYYPPNGWGCRCGVRQLTANNDIVKPVGYPSTNEVPTAFLNNAGQTGQLFTKDHPYFAETTAAQKAAILQTTYQFLLEESTAFNSSLKAVKKRGLESSLNDLEQGAVYHYTTKAVQDLNLKLRVGKEDDLNWAHAELLSQSIQKLPTYQGETYRFVHGKRILEKFQDSYNQNKPFKDEGFMSSTLSTDFIGTLLSVNKNRSERIILFIDGQNGKNIASMSKNEVQQEVLFNKNSSFDVLSISEQDGIHYIKLKEVQNGGND